jgi:hypothetical protein
MHFQQPNGHQTALALNAPPAYYGCLVVTPSTQFVAIFATAAEASAFLLSCPAGSSVQQVYMDWAPGASVYIAPNYSNPHYSWPTTCFIVLKNSDQSFMGLFETQSQANAFAASQTLGGTPCTAYTGSLQT